MTSKLEEKMTEIDEKTAPKKPAASPYTPPIKPKDDVIKYLGAKVEQLTLENRQLQELLRLYGEHAVAVYNLTATIFPHEAEEVSDIEGGE